MRLLVTAFAPLLLAGAPPIAFIPASPQAYSALDEYRILWETEGPEIIATLEEVTGLAFPEQPIDVIVTDGPPMTAYDGRTIRLRAGYSPAYKRATLVHELGHRLALLLGRDTGLDDHRLLYLFLYDAWTDLYGAAFADRMVSIERRIRGPGDYDAAWSWALAMTREQRQARLRALIEERIPKKSDLDVSRRRPDPVRPPSWIPAFAGIQMRQAPNSALLGEGWDPGPHDGSQPSPGCERSL